MELKLELDQKIPTKEQNMVEFMDKGESIKLTQRVISFDDSLREVETILVLTTRNVYNISPQVENPFQFLLKCICLSSRVQRRIKISQISEITISNSSDEFVIHVPNQQDQRYKNDVQQQRVLLKFCECFTKCNFSKLTVNISDEASLQNYTKSVFNKQNLKRPLADRIVNVNRTEFEVIIYFYKVSQRILDQGTSTRIVFQKKNSHIKIELDDFNLIKVLGTGAYGKVLLCKKNDTEELYAIKTLRKDKIKDRKQIEYIKSERKILEQVQLYQIFAQIDNVFLVSLDYCFQTKQKLFFVMKFMQGGELFGHLRKVTKFNEDTTRFYAASILLALEYLHQINIVYRDLKPENILMDELGYIALTDYGLARVVDGGEKAQSVVGTAEYLAPEIIQQEKDGYSLMVDWWSFGILIYEMLVGRTPFYSNSRSQLFKQIVEDDVNYPSNTYLTNEVQDIIKLLLKKTAKERLGSKGVDEIKQHPFFKDFNFQDLQDKKLVPPFIPEFSGEEDLRYFNPRFTNQSIYFDTYVFQGIKDTPAEEVESILIEQFYGMTYSGIKEKILP